MFHERILPKLKSVFLLFLFLTTSISGFAQVTYTWVGTTNTVWSTSTNWTRDSNPGDGSVIPRSSDYVFITAGKPQYPAMDANYIIAGLTVSAGSQMNLNGKTLTVTGAALSQIGSATLSTPSFGNIAMITAGGGTISVSGKLEMYFTTVTGNISVSGDLLIRRNEFKGTANLTQSQVFTSRTNGGNIFAGLATITQSGSGNWIWGNSAAALGTFTGADVFKAGLNASVNTGTTTELRFADNTLGNSFAGSTFITVQGVATVHIASLNTASANFTGAVAITNGSSNTNGVGINIASAGTVTFGSTLALSFLSSSIINVSSKIAADGDVGKVTFNGDVDISNLTNQDRRVYIGTNSSTAQTVDVASGKRIRVLSDLASNFTNGLISLSRFRALAGTQQQIFNVSDRAAVELNYGIFPQNLTMTGGEIDLNYNSIAGASTLTLARANPTSISPTPYAQLTSVASGNTFTGTATLTNNGDSNWQFGFVSADLFSGALLATCNTPSTTSSDPQGRYIMFAKGSAGTTVVGTATFSASTVANTLGSIIVGYENNSTATFQGAITINNGTRIPCRTVSFGNDGTDSNISFQNAITVNKTGNQGIKWGSDDARIIFSGSNTHNFLSNDPTESIYQLEVNKPSGIVSLVWVGAGATSRLFSITDKLLLTSGYLNVGPERLNLGTSVITGGSSASHIQALSTGVLMITVTSGTPTVFPVGQGSATTYQPITLTQNSGSDKSIQVRLGSEATASSVNRNWVVTQPVASNLANVDVVTQWASGTESGTVRPNADILQAQANGTYNNLDVKASLAGSDPYTLSKTAIPVISTTNIGTFAVSSTIKAYAGADFTVGVCALPTFLSASAVTGQTGTWSYVSSSGTNSSATVSFSNANNANSTVDNLAVSASHTLRWTLTPSGSSDDVIITISAASAGGLTQTWDGSFSTNWGDCQNWVGSPSGVPNANTDVFIPAGKPRYPILTAGVSCKNLTIDGGNINIANQILTSSGSVVFNTAFITSNGGSVFATAISSLNTFYTGAGSITLRNGNGNANSGLNTFQIPVTLSSNGTGNYIWGAYDDDFGTGGADVFNKILTLSNPSTGRIYVSYNTTGNVFNDNIVLNNTSTGNIGVGSSSYPIFTLPDLPTTSFLTAGKILDTSAGTASTNRGTVEIINIIQASGVTSQNHNLTFGNNQNVTMYRNVLHGNIPNMKGANLTIQNNTLGSIPATNTVTMTSFTTTQGVFCGGNTFNAITTLTLDPTASGIWAWGSSGGGDKFKGTLTANNNSTTASGTVVINTIPLSSGGVMLFADKTTNNTFEGNTTFNMGSGSTSTGSIFVAHGEGTSANFLGSANTVKFNNNSGALSAASFYVATKGDISVDGNAEFIFSNACHNLAGIYVAVDSGSAVFNGNIILDNQKAYAANVSQSIYFGNNASGFANPTPPSYVDLPNQITLASGKTLSVRSAVLGAVNFQVNNFTQYGTSTAQSLSNMGANSSLRLNKCTFNSNFTANSGSISAVSSIFAGNLNMTMNYGGGAVSGGGGISGGNTVTGNTFLTANATVASGDWIWGSGYDPFTSVLGVDNFNGNFAFSNTSVVNAFVTIGTVNASGLGTYNGGANVLGNTVLNVSSVGRIAIAPATNTTFGFAGNLTASATATSAINMGASGKIIANGSTNTTFTESGTLPNITIGNLEMNKTSSSIMTLGSFVSVTNSLNFIDGRIDVKTFNFDLGAGTLTGASPTSNVIANSTGTFSRLVSGTASLFPLATTTNYLPMTLTNSGTADRYNARLRYDINDKYNITTFVPSGNNIDAYYIKPIWIVSENVAGGSNLTMKLQWDSSTDEQLSFNRNATVIKNYNTGANQWDCKSSETASTLESGTYYSQQSSAFTTANLNTAFSVGTLVADGGSDFNVTGCNIFPLTAKVYNGTGPGVWSAFTIPMAAPAPTISTSTVVGAVSVSNVVTGQYIFKWETGSAAACTLKSDFVTVNFAGTGGAGTAPATARWNGLANNSNWFDCGNWENSQMPGVSTDVTIPFLTAGALAKYPIIANPVVIGGLFMSANAQLTINSSQNVTMTGENVSLTFVTITGSGSGSTASSLTHAVSTTTPMVVSNVRFPAGIRIFSPRLTIDNSNFVGTAIIEKTAGIGDDNWNGGNIFSATTQIVNRANDGSKLNLAFVTGDSFRNVTTFTIADANADIVPANNGTTEFRSGFTVQSVRDADFNLGTDANGKVLMMNTSAVAVGNSLMPNRNIVFQDLTVNQGSPTIDLTFSRNTKVMEKLTLTNGRVLLNGGAVFSLEKNTVGSLVGGSSNSYFRVENTGIFGRQIDNNGSNYLFPVGFTSAYRPMELGIANTLDQPEAFFVRMFNQVSTSYDNLNALTTAAIYDNEFISTAWVVTHADPTKNFANVMFRPYWTLTDETKTQTDSVKFERTRSFATQYDYNTNKFKCINTFAAATGAGTNASPYTIPATATGIADGLAFSTSFGVFSVASATATAKASTPANQVNACLIINLNATAGLESPPIGQWQFVGAFFTAGGNINFTSSGALLKNGTVGNEAPLPVIASPTLPYTLATNVVVSGIYQFRWKRFSTECGGSFASGIDEEDAFVTVQTSGAVISKTQTWNGSIDTNWNSCYNWSNWYPENDGTYDVIINGGATFYPVLPSDYSLKSLTINAGGKIDLNGKILTTQTINFNSALITDTGNSMNASGSLDGIYSGFITTTISATIRKSQFDGVFGIQNNGSVNTNNGGNRFMSATTIRHIGSSNWKFGWTDKNNSGGADIFESDVDVLTQDCGPYNFFDPRLGLFDPFGRADGPTNLATSLPQLDWIQQPFYNPGTAPSSATPVGNTVAGTNKVGFANYYRRDNFPTNTSDPAVDAANAQLNLDNAAANRADELQSLANVITGNANASAAYTDAFAAKIRIDDAFNDANNHLNNATIIRFLTAGEPGVTPALQAALQTAYDNLLANRNTPCYTGAGNTRSGVTTARDDVRNGSLTDVNPPGNTSVGGVKGDNLLANDARDLSNKANQCAIDTDPFVSALRNATNNVIRAYNATLSIIPLDNSPSVLSFAHNTTGTEFKGNATFTVRNCGKLRISEGAIINGTPATAFTTANAKFTGANKTITFINDSYANYDPYEVISRSGTNASASSFGYPIWTSINPKTNVSFEGANSTVYIRNQHRGGVRINELGTTDFKNGTNLVFSNFVSANTMWIGGKNNGTSWVNLDNGFLSAQNFVTGDVFLRNFRQFGSGFPTSINVDESARLIINGICQFDGNFTLTARRTTMSYVNRWSNNQDNSFLNVLPVDYRQRFITVSVAPYYETTQPSRRALHSRVISSRDSTFLYMGNNGGEKMTFNGSFKLLNSSTIFTYANIGVKGDIYFNGDVEVSNASPTRKQVGYDFGPGDIVPLEIIVEDSVGAIFLADAKTFRIGRQGFPGGGYLRIDRLIQTGSQKVNLTMPYAGFVYDYNGSFVTCGNKAGFQPCTPANSEIYLRRSTIGGGTRLEAPKLFMRNTTYADTVYAVVYDNAANQYSTTTARNIGVGSSNVGVDESSGGNTFNKKASFEFRGSAGKKWFFGGKNYRTIQNPANLSQTIVAYMEEPDIFKDSLILFNNGNNTEMALGYSSSGNQFLGDVVIRNRGRAASDFTGSVVVPPLSANTNLVGNLFRIGGDPTNFQPNGQPTPVKNSSGSKLVFEKSLTLMNESTSDIMVAAHPSDNITIKGDLTISNKKAPYYTGVDICGVNNYLGDVRFISGSTTVAATSNITVQNFPDGELEFTSVTIQGSSANLVNIDLSGQVAGDKGRGRITLQKSVFQRQMNVRSSWILFYGSTYEADASFERTSGCFFTAMGSVNMEGKGGNLYKGTFSLKEAASSPTPSASTEIRLASFANASNVFSGDIYQKSATFNVRSNIPNKGIRVAYNYMSQIAGDLNLDFTTIASLNFTSTSGLEFNGSGNQALNSTKKVVMSKVFVNQSAGSTITPNNSFDVTSQLFFARGKILLGSNIATIGNVDNVISVSVQYPNEGHIVANQSGTVNRVVNPSKDNITFTTVLFPVGNLTNYLPVTLVQRMAGKSDQFRARLLDDVYTTYNSSMNPSDDPAFDPAGSATAIDRNFVKRSWIVTEDVAGGTDGAIMIQWFEGGGGVASDEPIGFDRTTTTIVHYNNFSNQWRCMDGVAPVSGPPNIRRASYALSTTAAASTINDYKTKMGVFSVGSFTAGTGGTIQTCGAGSAQLSGNNLTPPLYGQWSFVNFASVTATFVTSDVSTTIIAAPAGFSFSSVNDAAALAKGLDANTAYRLRWTAQGLDGCNASYADYIVITGAFSNAITNKTLEWQGANAWFWYCQNWKVKNENYFALPDATMDLVVPFTSAVTNNVGVQEVYQPILYDRGVTVKSLTIKDKANFSLAFQSVNGTANGLIQFTVNEFLTVESGGLYNNAQVTTINGNTENAGEIRSFVTAEALLVPLAEKPALLMEFKGNLKNTGVFNHNENIVRIYKDLENSGAGVVFHTAGKVEFLGTTNQFITGGNDVKLFNVDVNKTIASNDKLTLAKTNLWINPNGALNFVSGTISSYSPSSWYGGNAIYTSSVYAPSALIFDAGSTYAGSDSYKYVTGPVSKIGDTPFEFPLGKGGYWARLALSDLQGSNPTDKFTAEYFNFQYSNITTFKAVPTVAPKLTRVSYVEHWQLNRDLGNAQPKVTLFWENGTRSGVGNLAKLYVGHFDSSSQWDDMGGNVSGSSTAAKGSVTSTANFLNFSPTTLATDDPTNNPLPVEWLYVRAKLVQDEEAALVEWATIFEANTDYFEVQKSLDGLIFKAIGIQKAAKNSSNVSNYNFLDNNPYSGISYYRIRQVDADGQETYSRTVSVSRSKTAKQSFYVFPSPTVSSNVNLLINSNSDGEVTLILNNTLGAIMYSAKIKVEKGENRIALSDLNLPNGVYFARLAEFGLISKFEIQQ